MNIWTLKTTTQQRTTLETCSVLQLDGVAEEAVADVGERRDVEHDDEVDDGARHVGVESVERFGDAGHVRVGHVRLLRGNDVITYIYLPSISNCNCLFTPLHVYAYTCTRTCTCTVGGALVF